jgi:hypothetical protein
MNYTQKDGFYIATGLSPQYGRPIMLQLREEIQEVRTLFKKALQVRTLRQKAEAFTAEAIAQDNLPPELANIVTQALLELYKK